MCVCTGVKVCGCGHALNVVCLCVVFLYVMCQLVSMWVHVHACLYAYMTEEREGLRQSN